ncbi:translation initiation factor IF-3, N-terminal domain-containing protein [Entophlyctis helioformis]|nr:translation initiation factor IF-3, N-terminal domain-containing protein [Entophlyctis helioformis]
MTQHRLLATLPASSAKTSTGSNSSSSSSSGKKGGDAVGTKNAGIKAEHVLVISATGEVLGVKALREALALFDPRESDLVMVSPNQNPPVCRIVSRKAAYDKKKAAAAGSSSGAAQPDLAAQQRKRHAGVVKEFEVNSTISDHDLDVKLSKAEQLLDKGYRLQITIFERGNKQSAAVLKAIVEKLQGIAGVHGTPTVANKRIVLVMDPKSKPAPASSSAPVKPSASPLPMPSRPSK